MLEVALASYKASLNALNEQLRSRVDDVLNSKVFESPANVSKGLQDVWSDYEKLCAESNAYTVSLGKEQESARESLRLKEVLDFALIIKYDEQLSVIEEVDEKREELNQRKESFEVAIRNKLDGIALKKRELNDEEKGAQKVNEYLQNFFGYCFLKLEAKEEQRSGEQFKRIRFEVIRDNKKAYHLSEGECSLLAFCYFLAKLDDVNTQGVKPVVWIDDPISSLDGNHIFFIYSLLQTEIVSSEKFEQLFVSTHNLDFLKYLKRLNGSYIGENGKKRSFDKGWFVVVRREDSSVIKVMPDYLKEHGAEFSYLFEQIYKCSMIEDVNDDNYAVLYNFGNSARKFFEIYLYYRYPAQGMTIETLGWFFEGDTISATLIYRLNNELSHLNNERGSLPVESSEIQMVAKRIIDQLKQDPNQYASLLESINVQEEQGNDQLVSVKSPVAD